MSKVLFSFVDFMIAEAHPSNDKLNRIVRVIWLIYGECNQLKGLSFTAKGILEKCIEIKKSFAYKICLDEVVNKDTGDSVSANSSAGGGSAGRSGSSTSPPAVKPPYTYTELIEQALSEKGPLTVAEIYRWIS